MRYPKQNSVIRLKPKTFWPPYKFLGWLRYWFE